MTDDSAIRIAVIGSGPAGFYAAGHLLKDATERIEVDMIERLPTPWGLVRSGVAPDHPKIKSVTRVYEKTAAHPRFRYFGNVAFGEHVSREELLEHYHAIVYATGSPLDRPLGIDGEDLPGSHAATEFVGWYNGHPDHTDLEVDLLSAERAIVIGNGNVGVGRRPHARARALPSSSRRTRPITRSRCSPRAGSPRSSIVGRRGPAQAAFTNPELLELGELADADVIVDQAELDRALAVVDADAEDDITSRRNVEILRDYAARPPRAIPSASSCASCARPAAFLPDEHGHLGAVELVAQRAGARPPAAFARAGHRRSVRRSPAGLAFRAIGYRGMPLPGVPFDERSAIIPNEGGRVLDPQSGACSPASTSSAGSSGDRRA